jgi:hypothetical protein
MNTSLVTFLRGTSREDHSILDQVKHGKKPSQDQDQQARADVQDGPPARSLPAGG